MKARQVLSRLWWLVTQRRFWVAAAPALVMILNVFGVEATEEMLTSTAEKLLGAGVSAGALWSLFVPRKGSQAAGLAAVSLVLLAGCASVPGVYRFDADSYLALSSTHGSAAALSAELCEAHDSAAAALRDPTGEAWVLPVIGRAPAVQAQARDHEESAIDCRLLVSRGAPGTEAAAAWLEADNRIWAAGAGLVRNQ